MEAVFIALWAIVAAIGGAYFGQLIARTFRPPNN
jgi:hypothetical protein